MEKSRDLIRALNAIAWYQARRDHSPHELQTKMAKRHSKENIAAAIAEARERRLIKPDEELALQWAESLTRKGRSQRYISGYLRKHRLPSVTLDRDAELETCRRLLKTKFGKAVKFDREEQAKVVRFLKYRGFAFQTIRRVIYEEP